MQTAMILAAGLGTRLRPLTDELPKPLVPVGDAPALAQIQRWMARFGVARTLINTHHLADRFAGAALPLPNELVHEPAILGTAGGVANIRGRIDASAPLLVWNGDILAEVAIDRLTAALEGGAVAAWSVAPRARGEGTVGLDERGRVVRLRQVRRGVEARGGDFLGVQVLAPALLARLPASGCMVGDVLAPMLERGAEIQAVDHEQPWDDIGSLGAYLAANLRWLGERERYLGPGARCEGEARQSVVGAGARVTGPLERVVIWPGVEHHGALRDAVVTARGVVPVSAGVG